MKIDLRPNSEVSDRNARLHFYADGDEENKPAPGSERLHEEVLEFVHRRAAEMNPDLDPSLPLCGGCMAALLINIYKQMVRAGDATYGQAAALAKALANDFRAAAISASARAIIEGEDAKVWGREEEMADVE